MKSLCKSKKSFLQHRPASLINWIFSCRLWLKPRVWKQVSFLWKRKASRFMTRLPPHWEISFWTPRKNRLMFKWTARRAWSFLMTENGQVKRCSTFWIMRWNIRRRAVKSGFRLKVGKCMWKLTLLIEKQLSYLLWVFLLDYCWDGRLVGCCCLRL